MSEETARLVDRLRDRLRRTVRRITWAETAFGAAVVLGTVAAVWLAGVAIEAGLWLGTTPRTALAVIVAGVTLAAVGIYLAKPLGRLLGIVDPPSEEEVARTIGRRYPEVSDRLVNLLQIAAGRRSNAPEPMVDRAVERLGSEVEKVPFEEVETFERARTAARLASLPVVAVLAFVLVAPATFFGASERLLTPTKHYQRPAPFQLSVEPGDTKLVKGDSLQLSVRATGEAPPTVTLAMQNEGETGTDTVTLQADSTGVYTHTISGVRSDLRYRVEARPVATAWYRAEVMARPLVRRLQVRLQPPAYTGLPERTLDANVGDVTGLPGTRVEVTTEVGGPSVDSAYVAFEDGSTAPMTVEDGTATGTFRLREEGAYQVRLRSTTGVANRDPIRYQLSLRADAKPSVVFLAPEASATIDEDLAAELRLRLSDDFGFARMKLYYRLSEQRFGEGQSEFSSIDIPLQNPRTLDQEVVYDWLMAQDSGLDLVPGDVVEYYVKVWDNDAVAGYKSATTQRQTLRLPSLAEKYERLDEEQSSVQDQMEKLQDEAESMDRQFENLQDELRRKQSADWEDRRQLDQVENKQQQIEKGVQELSRKMEELSNQMQRDDLTSSETAKMYEELQRVIEEINSPELKQALDQLRKSMENMDLRQMQEAMENFQFNEEQYRERLQRSLDLFKQIKAQQKLEEMSKRLGNLSKLEERLAEETKKLEEKNEGAKGEPDADAQERDGERESEDNPGAENQGEEKQGAQNPSEQASGEQKSGEQDPSSEDGSKQRQEGNSPEDASQKSLENAPQDASQKQPQGENAELAKEQERAAEEMRKIMDEMQKLSDEMKDVRSAPQKQMQQMQQQMQQQDLPKQMQQNSQQLQQNQLQKAREGQQQMQQQLQQMQQRMQQMQQGMQGQQKQVNMAGLRSALDNTLRLSQQQESLRRTVDDLTDDSPALRPYAQQQQELVSGLESVSDSLQSLARNVPQMSRAVQKETGDALREMKSATSSLSEREASRATGHQKGSMMHLNELALLLSDLMDQMQSGSGSGSGMSMQQMMQQLQKMTGQQQKMNQQLQQFLNDVQGNRLSVDQKERLKQLARQQQQIQKELKNLSEKSGESGRNVLGDLNRIAEQMEKTIQELQKGRQNRETLDRQRQILTRMLQAQKSLRTQGKKEERKGSTSEDEFERRSPDELSPQQEAEKLRRDLIRALETGYAPDYEELIKRYFELLQENGASRNGGSGSGDSGSPTGSDG